MLAVPRKRLEERRSRMIPGFIKKYALRSLMKKAVELHKADNSVEQIAQKFWNEDKVAEGLTALSITDEELIKMIEKEIKKKGKK